MALPLGHAAAPVSPARYARDQACRLIPHIGKCKAARSNSSGVLHDEIFEVRFSPSAGIGKSRDDIASAHSANKPASKSVMAPVTKRQADAIPTVCRPPSVA